MVVALCVVTSLLVQPLSSPPVVVLSLSSTPTGQDVPPGSAIAWSIAATAPPAGSGTFGLAAISADLVQSPANPRLFNIPPATAVPAAMAGFSRPQGVCNPVPGGSASAYGGTPLGPTNAMNLVQIGGAQNTFGVPGMGIGLDTTVDTGIGQASGGQVVASGVFYAPAAAGSYSFSIENALANLLVTVRPAPDFSSVVRADVLVIGGITFSIDCPADWNNDGAVNSTDISAFLSTWLDSVNNGNTAADFNGDGAVNSTDISAHLTAWLDAVENGC